ncbi:phage head-tail connector protein [Vagococcus vulneris]|uniref:phage head-tail connector protein n=1 Tax=Vagococcus vulneris TaxID=1977869 RepID=UPI000F7F3EDF|nr:phage head-tail connector protein [Vagococcus vulneris]
MSTHEDIKKRVKVRESKISDELLDEYLTTALDRIKLYTGINDLPIEFNSIIVDVVLAMYRRKYYEGIEQEKADVFSVKFINNILSQFDREFQNYKRKKAEELNNLSGKIVFK